jgi:FkbM family methyltransferase
VSNRLKTERGLLWPEYDSACAAVVFDSLQDLDKILSMFSARDTVVQAGGNCGVWPKHLAKFFRVVYTFEPDPTNFRCLCANAYEENIYKFCAALGDKRGCVEIVPPESHNCGALCVGEAGDSPVLRVDDLGLKKLDYLCLDAEGYEPEIVEGAWQAICRFRPVISFEEKGLSTRYGRPREALQRQLVDQLGYRVAEQIGNDTILLPGV